MELIVLFFGILVSSTAGFAADFTGVWVLDRAKTTPSAADSVTTSAMNVEQCGNRVSVLELAEGKDGKRLVRRVFLLDGANGGQIRAVRNGEVVLEEWEQHGDQELLIVRTGQRSTERLVFKRANEFRLATRE